MNDGLLLVNFNALATAGGDIQKALNALKNDLDELKADGDKLVATWNGEAKEAYFRRQKTWTTAAEDLSMILREIQGAVESAKIGYQDTERRATQRFS